MLASASGFRWQLASMCVTDLTSGLVSSLVCRSEKLAQMQLVSAYE